MPITEDHPAVEAASDAFADAYTRYTSDGLFGERAAALKILRAALPHLKPEDVPSDGLTFEDFAQENRARCESPQGFEKPVSDWALSDWITAAVGEFGEMANVAKKLNRIRDGIPGNGDLTEDDLRAMLADEIADTFIYLDLLTQSQGLSLAEIVVAKFDKTSAKIGYPRRLSDDKEQTND